MLYDALFYEKLNGKVNCFLCPHHCLISEGKFGLCSVRTNAGGTLKTINYGEVTAIALDPIEKKPLYHFESGSKILSVGSFGCNFSCGFCQNYSIAHHRAESKYYAPHELVDIIISIKDNIGIAFTYNEPSIWYEYVYDTSKLLKEKHPEFKVILVTNGYIEKEPLARLLPYVDAMNIDLKSFSQDFYKKECRGDLGSVKRTIEAAYDKCHVEITTLLIGGLNDFMKEIEEIAAYLGSLDKNIPLHLSRYFPHYKMDRPPTDISVMIKARDIAKEYLDYVYLGNV